MVKNSVKIYNYFIALLPLNVPDVVIMFASGRYQTLLRYPTSRCLILKPQRYIYLRSWYLILLKVSL